MLACAYLYCPPRTSHDILTLYAQCATSLASTFDPDLVYQAGVYLGQEAKIKSSTVLLAPTCNIQRTPLGGRSFESFSEDPFLSGLHFTRLLRDYTRMVNGLNFTGIMTAAYVNGLQSEGVSASV